MPTAPTITFRHMQPSPTLEQEIRRQIAELAFAFERLESCHVVVDQPHLHQQRGRLYRITLELGLPGRRIVVGRVPDDPTHADPYLAVRDAFRAARRQIEERSDRGRVSHTPA
jgi:hypothetical protein